LTSRVVYAAALLAVLLAGSVFLTFRYWVLPNADNLRAYVVEEAERRIGRRITVGELEINWSGLRPDLTLSEVHVFDARGFPVLTFDTVHAVLSWRSLLAREPTVRLLVIDGPHLNIQRAEDGRLFVAGILLPDQAGEDVGEAPLTDWLLRQGEVVVTGARITWEDAQRGAPPLTLERVELRLQNAGARHRAAMRASAPQALGGGIDLRADLNLAGMANWLHASGEIYLAAGELTLEAWRPWVELPLELNRGRGALRAWLTLTDGRFAASTVDANLAGVSARLAPELPKLDVTQVMGRVGWRDNPEGWEISTRRLQLVTEDSIRIGPTDLSLASGVGDAERPASVRFSANRIDLGAFAALAGHLPLNEATRAEIAALAPRGALSDVVAAWDGELPAPKSYRVRARFADLHLEPLGLAPGLSGVSGELDGNELHGRFAIDGKRARVAMPKVFTAPLAFDSLAVRGAWSGAGGGTEVTLQKAEFANGDLAGSVSGEYNTSPAGPGRANMTAALSRIELRAAHNYLPLAVGPSTREWIRSALLSGRAVGTRVTLNGDLAKFPFADEGAGLFEASAKVVGADIQYADAWPRVEGVSADVLFKGVAMRVSEAAGTILGIPVAHARATIPDLDAKLTQLDVELTAQGDTERFLRLVAQSPVDGYIDGFTRRMTASGAGRLDLTLDLPLDHIDDAKVRGRYRFISNRVVMSRETPIMEDVSGDLAFTEREVSTEALKGRTMGGPFKLTAAARNGVFRIEAGGRADADAWKATSKFDWVRYLSGSTDWNYSRTARGNRVEESLRSSLKGLGLSYPAPVNKAAAQGQPFSIERVRFAGRETVSLKMGTVLSAQTTATMGDGGSTLESVALVLGAGSAQASRPGMWVSGSAPAVDVDGWREVLRGGAAEPQLTLQGIDLSAGRVFALNRMFRDLRVQGEQRDGALRLNVDGLEVAGQVVWDAAGEGAMQARLSRLVIPSDETLGRSGERSGPEARSLPALDIVADSFSLGTRPMGRLELQARNEGGLWRVGLLELRHPDSVINADGEWNGRASPPTTAFNVRLEAKDLGSFAARIGIGEGLHGGSGSVNGRIEWAGSPYKVDYPTLGGALKLDLKDGRFEAVEPGMAKLLGVLSLSALPRRLGGDFNDVFGKGFSFQQINADARLAQGVARTDNLSVVSSSVRVSMRGEVNLARESQSLQVRVTPELSETAALASGVIGGPIVGLATLAVAKLFRDPIGRLAGLDYTISGSWSDPQVARLTPVTKPEPQ
jgi:uncharacterized protein (TIGR02099 family)